MTFTSAISSLRNGYAAKRPSWKGYISCKASIEDYFEQNPPKTVGSPTEGETADAQSAISGGWRILEFHLADGATVVPYVFDSDASNDIKMDGEAVSKDGSTLAPYTGYVPLTQFLLEAILESDWETVPVSSAEVVLAGTNEY